MWIYRQILQESGQQSVLVLVRGASVRLLNFDYCENPWLAALSRESGQRDELKILWEYQPTGVAVAAALIPAGARLICARRAFVGSLWNTSLWP
jgi:hypothetical protein